MPRDANGDYTLPVGNPVVDGTDIEASWANTTMDDIADAITDSLSRSGEGGMLAPLEFNDGTSGAPGITWEDETSTGLYRAAANDMRATVAGNDKARWTATAGTPMELYDGTNWGAVHFGLTQSFFTATFDGFSAAPDPATVRYVVYGKQVFLHFGFSVGTSDDTEFQITNLPEALRPDRQQVVPIVDGIDNSVNVTGVAVRIQTDGNIFFTLDGDVNGWTNSGSKGLASTDGYTISYFLDFNA